MELARKQLLITVSVTAAAIGMSGSGRASPIIVNDMFAYLDHRGVNSVGQSTGERISFGSTDVSPNDFGGTTGTIQFSDGSTSPLFFQAFTTAPNFVSRTVGDNAALRGSATMTFHNGLDSIVVETPVVGSVEQMPFVNSVTISGSGAHPTFSWTIPTGVTPDAVRINIYDRSHQVQLGSADVVLTKDFAGSVTSYTVDEALAGGKTLTAGTPYAIEIGLLDTRDNTALGGNPNILRRSRAYFDFTPLSEGAPPKVVLPTLIDTGAYTFHTAVKAGETVFIDPLVAVGYDYATGAGDPNFRTVLLPADIGDGKYDIYTYDALGNLMLLFDDALGGSVYDFGAAGVDKFRVLGIETDAGLDPGNATAFITGLTFTGDGDFTGTQTPITAAVSAVSVPEPGSLALLAVGIFGVGAVRNRTRRDRVSG